MADRTHQEDLAIKYNAYSNHNLAARQTVMELQDVLSNAKSRKERIDTRVMLLGAQAALHESYKHLAELTSTVLYKGNEDMFSVAEIDTARKFYVDMVLSKEPDAEIVNATLFGHSIISGKHAETYDKLKENK